MRKGQRFARAFKRAVAVEYLQSGEERKVIAMKYGLPNVQTVSNWVSLYLTPHEIETKCIKLPRINVNAIEMSNGCYLHLVTEGYSAWMICKICLLLSFWAFSRSPGFLKHVLTISAMSFCSM